MESQQLEALKYPIGKFVVPEVITSEIISEWINTIEGFPNKTITLTENLSVEELNFLYRPNGWNIKQVVHHCADSHVNAYTRFKLALTEDVPAIRPYKEAFWAQLPDGNRDDITDSLMILKWVHHRWVFILKAMSDNDLDRRFFHPQHNTEFAVKQLIGQYHWHCNHHFAHIQQGLRHRGEFN